MQAVVVDATELIDEVLARVRNEPGPSLLSPAERGHFRLFASQHVRAEVPQKILEQFKRRGASPQEGVRLWESEYLPFIYFVDTSELVIVVEGIDELSREDQSDLGTAKLVTLLAPVISLSHDKDLLRHGFARNVTWQVAWEAEGRADSIATMTATMVPFYAPAAGATALIKGAVRQAGVVGGLLVAGGLVYLTYLGARRFSRANDDTKKAVLEFVEKVLEMMMTAQKRREISERRLDDARVPQLTLGTPLVAEIASTLAVAEEPLTTTEIARELWGEENVLPKTFFNEVHAELVRIPAFVTMDPYRWQLGSQAAS